MDTFFRKCDRVIGPDGHEWATAARVADMYGFESEKALMVNVVRKHHQFFDEGKDYAVKIQDGRPIMILSLSGILKVSCKATTPEADAVFSHITDSFVMERRENPYLFIGDSLSLLGF